MLARSLWLVCLAGMVLLGLSAEGQGQQKKVEPKKTVLQGVEVVRYHFGRNDYAKTVESANQFLFPDIYQPETLDLLIRALEAQKKRDEAAVMATWLLRVLEKATPAEVKKYKDATEKKLAPWNKEFEQLQAKYAASAADKKFESADKVDDLWMTQVKADLTSPHALYAYDLIGGRKYNDPEHTAIASKGVMHRSGLRYVDEVAGRKGILFGVPMRADGPGLAKNKLDHPPQVKMTNLGKGSVLRMGVKGFGFPFQLKVYVGGKEIFTQLIPEKQWSDLKIDLGEAAGKSVEVTVELVVPENQKFSEGVWIDYMDFFTN